MGTSSQADLESLLAELDESARAGQSVAAVARTWRFAGIIDPNEVRSWLAVGVFDGHRAGLLRLAGLDAETLSAIPNGRQIGLEFALGKLSVAEICNLVVMLQAAADVPGTAAAVTYVRPTDRLRGTSEGSGES